MRIYKPTAWGVAIYNNRTGEQTGAAVGLTLEQTLGRNLTARERVMLAWNGFIFSR